MAEAKEISERLALVEKSMRRYRAALAAVTVIAVAELAEGQPFVGAAKAPEVIQAKRFEVVSDSGEVLAAVYTKGETASLSFYDKARTERAELGMVDDELSLNLFDKTGTLRTELGTSGDREFLNLYDKAIRPSASLDTSGDDTSLILADKAGKTRVALDTSGDDTFLSLYDKAGNARATLGNNDLKIPATGSTEHRAASSLVLFNEHGRVLWEAP